MQARLIHSTRPTVRSLHSLTQQAWNRELSRAKQRLTEGDLTVRLTTNSFYPTTYLFTQGQVQRFSDWYQSTTGPSTCQLKAISFGGGQLMMAVSERSDRFDIE